MDGMDKMRIKLYQLSTWLKLKLKLSLAIIHFSFNHRCKKRLRIAVWFTVKILFLIYLNRCENKMQLLAEMQREIEWNLKMARQMGSLSEVLERMCSKSTELKQIKVMFTFANFT